MVKLLCTLPVFAAGSVAISYLWGDLAVNKIVAWIGSIAGIAFLGLSIYSVFIEQVPKIALSLLFFILFACLSVVSLVQIRSTGKKPSKFTFIWIGVGIVGTLLVVIMDVVAFFAV